MQRALVRNQFPCCRGLDDEFPTTAPRTIPEGYAYGGPDFDMARTIPPWCKHHTAVVPAPYCPVHAVRTSHNPPPCASTPPWHRQFLQDGVLSGARNPG
jgi:hypothetical protein